MNNNEQIINSYTKLNKSIQTIANKLQTTTRYVSETLKQNGIKIRNSSESHRKYPLDETMFENINTEFKAYFLGWMFSDGNVYIKSKRHTLSITVVETDKEILDKFNKIIFDNKKPLNYRKAKDKITPKKIYKCKPCWRLLIDSKKLCENIQELGCVPNKSKIIQLPNIPENMFRHFLRGYFDGDGCITSNGKNWGSFVIISSYDFVTQLQLKFKKLFNIESAIHTSTGCYNLTVKVRNDIILLFNYMYQNSTIYLDRKYNKFKLIVDKLLNCKPKTSKYKNISFNSKSKMWVAQKNINKQHVWLGRFKTEEEANLKILKYMSTIKLTPINRKKPQNIAS
mgnify:CR=1 FL=1